MRLVQGILKVRFIVVLSLIYLSLVLFLYQYLWKTNNLDSGLSLIDFSQNSVPHNRDVFEFSGDKVEFNFKRRNGLLHQYSSRRTWNVSSQLELVAENVSSNVSSSQDIWNMRTPLFNLSDVTAPSKCVHAFYYMWYGNPERDGKYFHWNHQYLPHWDTAKSKKYPQGRHNPPDDIGASFYPELGCYSSSNPRVIETHMYQLRKAGVGVVSVSWYPVGMADGEGFPPDRLILLLLDIAQAYSIQVTFHIEPYKGRSPQTVKNDLRYIVETYSKYPAFYKLTHQGSKISLPLVYLYDSYLNTAQEWAGVLQPGRPDSIRGTDVDCIVLALLVEQSHLKSIVDGGFDGFYTYFASNGFSYGSTIRHWGKLAEFARKHGLIFVPSVGPGYDDVQVRPWNERNKKSRRGGAYYKEMLQAAMGADANLISITSFNEWHEGTQIETSIPKRTPDHYTYLDFTPHQPDFYLKLTKDFIQQMQCK